MARPWRGLNYAESENVIGGARLLILGEAHYSEEVPVGVEIPEITENVVQDYIDGRLRSNATFFRRIERLVTGKLSSGLTERQSSQFWHSVIFYNYIPVIAGKGPGDRPLREHWGGETPDLFRAIVNRHEAEIVLVCGRELWRKKPLDRAIIDAYNVDGRYFEAHEINWSKEYGAVAAHILHPSGYAGWTYEAALPAVAYLFEAIDQRRAAKEAPLLADWRSVLS